MYTDRDSVGVSESLQMAKEAPPNEDIDWDGTYVERGLLKGGIKIHAVDGDCTFDRDVQQTKRYKIQQTALSQQSAQSGRRSGSGGFCGA